MATETLRFACIADAQVREPNLGAGKSNELPIGLSGGNVHRSLLRFAPIDWAGLHVSRIVSAEIQDRNTASGGVQVARGASPRVIAWRITESWSEGAAASLSSANATRWDNMPTRTSAGEGTSAVLPTTGGTFAHLPCTDIVKAWAPLTIEGGGGKPNYGIMLRSFDELSTSRTTELYSRESSFDPVLVVVVETNLPPEAPINLSPADGGIGGVASGAITFRGERVDPDVGDYITAVEVAVHADSATDGAPGSAIVSAIQAFTTKLPTFELALSAALLVLGTNYRWRARTRDKGGLWGAWSSFADGRFVATVVPDPPINLAVDTTSLTPHFFGSIAEGTLGAVRIVVYQDTTAGVILKWDSGFDATSGTRFEVTYGGTPLEVGMLGLRWAAAIRNSDGAESPLSAFQYWTPAAITGPTAMSPIDVETKQDTLTPELTIGHSAAFDAYELEVARFADGSGPLWDVPVTTVASTSSTDVTYAGTALTWGRVYYWRAKVRVAGTTWTDWSAWYPFYVNALPLAPVVSVDDAVDSGDHVTTTDTTPVIRIPFDDPDIARGYTEAPTRREIEIEELDGTPFGASPFVITAGITETYTPSALTAETIYRVRARYDDSSGQRSPWSAYLYVKASTAPVIAEETAIDPADPNPLVDWTFSSAPGKPQAALRVRIFADATDELVHDSGLVASAVTSYEVPGDILEDATDYRYEVTAYDTDLLSDELVSSPWTTAFGTPDPVENLVAVADAAGSSVVLTWDVSTLDPDYFWRYLIYRVDASGAFVLVGSVDDIATPTFTDGDAPHGTTTYAVTVSNGWAESAAVTVTVTLDLHWWIFDPTGTVPPFEVRYVSGFGDHRDYDQEAHHALGRATPIVVSGELIEPAGQFRVFLVPDESGTYDLLQRVARVDPYVVLKDPFGGIWKMKLGSLSRDRGDAGSQTITVPYQVVAV